MAVFVIEPTALIVALIFRVRLAALAKLPIVQTPVAALYSAEGSALTNVNEAGKTSLTVTFVALFGPSLEATTL
nr:hypothetical protein [Runella sp. CRIBMP]